MFCERCGRFTLFKKMCADCALTTTVQPTESPAPSAAPFLTALGTALGKTLGAQLKTRCIMSIDVNGKKATFNLDGGISDRLVQQVADQTKLTLEQARALLQAQGSPERLIEVGNDIARSRPPSTMKCLACAHDVPPGRFCSQCGHPLA
mgnify:CR=1 FL=1